MLGYVHSENDHVRTRSKIPGVDPSKLGAKLCLQEVHALARSGPTILLRMVPYINTMLIQIQAT